MIGDIFCAQHTDLESQSNLLIYICFRLYRLVVAALMNYRIFWTPNKIANCWPPCLWFTAARFLNVVIISANMSSGETRVFSTQYSLNIWRRFCFFRAFTEN